MTEVLKQAPKGRHTELFDAFDEIRSQEEPLWLHRIRSEAMERFTELGMPVVRELSFPLKEDWIYTDLRTIADTTYHTEPVPAEISEAMISPYEFGQKDWHKIVIVNGVYSPSLSRISDLPPGAFVGRLADALINHPELVHPYLGRGADFENNGLTALNTALFRD